MPLFAALVSASGVAGSQVSWVLFVWALLGGFGSVGLGLCVVRFRALPAWASSVSGPMI